MCGRFTIAFDIEDLSDELGIAEIPIDWQPRYNVTPSQPVLAATDAATRKAAILAECRKIGLLDTERLSKARILNAQQNTICPLCLEELSGQRFFNRMEQAGGRNVPDLTVTQVNLFHIQELKTGILNHRPYNVGWGHHHCNVVVKDSGILETLVWMRDVVERNKAGGHFPAENKAS